VVDVLFVVILMAFFALMVLFVRFCEHVVGKESAAGTGTAPEPHGDTRTDTVTEEVPA
jgi:hypothetical protein